MLLGQDDPDGAFVLNVVVKETMRGNGVGQALMTAASELATNSWQAQRLFTHVDCNNEARTHHCKHRPVLTFRKTFEMNDIGVAGGVQSVRHMRLRCLQ